MNILIFNPPVIDRLKYVREGRCEQRLSSFQYVMVPISLPYIAGLLLKNKFKVKIIDAIAEDYQFNTLIKKIKQFKPQLCIVNISTATYSNDIEIIRLLKEQGVLGYFIGIGVHVTALSQEVLKQSELDIVIKGEPEMVSLNIAKKINKGLKALRSVKGISYKLNKKIMHNPDQELLKDLDKLPFPARHLIKNELYTLPVINEPYTLLVPSRGCPFKCIFCTARNYYGRRTRFRSVKSVIAELKEIIFVNKVHNVTMWSDTFTLNKKFVIDICKAIIKEKLPLTWFCNSRVDTVDDETLSWMARSGCIGISYGIESGVQKILNNVKKGITIKQIEKAITLTNKHGIESLAHVIFGLPGETRRTIDKTIQFIKDIKPTYAQFYCAIPFPGTDFFSLAKKNNWLVVKDWSLFEINRAIIQTPQLSTRDLDKARKKAYIKFYLRFSYIWERLLAIRSFRDFFLSVKQFFHFIYTWVIHPS